MDADGDEEGESQEREVSFNQERSRIAKGGSRGERNSSGSQNVCTITHDVCVFSNDRVTDVVLVSTG